MKSTERGWLADAWDVMSWQECMHAVYVWFAADTAAAHRLFYYKFRRRRRRKPGTTFMQIFARAQISYPRSIAKYGIREWYASELLRSRLLEMLSEPRDNGAGVVKLASLMCQKCVFQLHICRVQGLRWVSGAYHWNISSLFRFLWCFYASRHHQRIRRRLHL